MFSVSKARHAFPTGPSLKLHVIEVREGRGGGGGGNRLPVYLTSCGNSTVTG